MLSIGRRRRALDEALGKTEAGAELTLAAGHFAIVGFVVLSGQMEKSVEDEDLQLAGEGVALVGGLAAGRVHADGQVAGQFFRPDTLCGKGEHVGGFVFAAELAVEFFDGGIGGQQDVDLAAEPDSLLGFSEKAPQGWLGGNPLDPGGDRAGPGGKGCCHEFSRGGVGVQIWVDENHLARGR
jgi:hypothetical protein